MGQRLAIIGGDAAGMSAAANARRRDPDLGIVAFERSGYTSFSACGIPYHVAGLVDESDDLIARSPDQHRANGIDVRIRHEVLAVDLARRELTVLDRNARRESTEPFDQLVVATGAHATPPPIPGVEATEPARTIDAAGRLRGQILRGGADAVVIGGGYIGLEMAEALVHRNLRVTLVDREPQLMTTLDADMAAHVQDAAEGQDIRVVLSAQVEEVLLDGDGRPRGVRTSDGDIAAEHVVMATGVRPATEVAEAAGLEIGESGALRVDDHQRCPGHDGVWAAGDCVESWHRLLERPVNLQLGTHANKQGRIAGVNATGGDLAFPGVLGTAISRICHREIARTGLSESEAEAAAIDVVATTVKTDTRAAYFPGSASMWVKLVAGREDRRLLGAQIVGSQTAGKRIDTLATCIWAGMTVDEIQWLDLAYAPPVSGVLDPVLVAARAAAKR
ncbi:FAD-dependent oxidoreductase [Capillimicrobium parvum]|uniref:Coenzyme A disulfide reductase n=1 Tax=Capillimicrobium parvum TaxID=2884022 RepID=A0A9E7BZ59_9ACTN|nr:FAD-dependent oxidoreductase [Capillimicrobium parvum]UGS34152.1 Coenzyme A disulfide reductase [Capillimicrobium parvum]